MALNKKAAEAALQAAQEAAQAPEPPEPEKNTDEMKDAATGAQDVAERGTYVYIGPSLPHGRLKHNFILQGTREEINSYLSDVLEDFPQVRRLVVPAAQLAEATRKATMKGNILNKFYNDVLSTAASVGKKEE